MASIVSAGTTSGTALNMSGDTSGVLQLASNNGTTAVTIDTSQNVGIGTASPSYKLDVQGTTANQRISSTTGTNAAYQIFSNSGQNFYVGLDNSAGNQILSAAYGATFLGTGAYPMVFGTNNAERMRIDSSGNLLSANGVIQFTSPQYRSTVASSQLQFINNSAGVSLAVNGTSWGSLSDERDKEIIEPITNAVSKVSSLRSVIGRYKVDEVDKRRAFLIAQDVQAVLPEAVTELENEQKTLILQYTEIIPLLVASIKEQAETINALTARVVALEAK